MRKIALICSMVVITAAGCAAPLNTRERAALTGGALGVGTGALIGSATGHAATGAAIGGPLGLLAGALIGDQILAREREAEQLERRIEADERELRRLRAAITRLKRERHRAALEDWDDGDS